jgi:hypothetical protein
MVGKSTVEAVGDGIFLSLKATRCSYAPTGLLRGWGLTTGLTPWAKFYRPYGTLAFSFANHRAAPWAKVCRPYGTALFAGRLRSTVYGLPFAVGVQNGGVGARHASPWWGAHPICIVVPTEGEACLAPTMVFSLP